MLCRRRSFPLLSILLPQCILKIEWKYLQNIDEISFSITFHTYRDHFRQISRSRDPSSRISNLKHTHIARSIDSHSEERIINQFKSVLHTMHSILWKSIERQASFVLENLFVKAQYQQILRKERWAVCKDVAGVWQI